MRITFDNQADIILWTLAELLVNIEQPQYPFVDQCIWEITTLVQLDPALWYDLEFHMFPWEVSNEVEFWDSIQVSTQGEATSSLWDIPRESETDEYELPVQGLCQTDPLRRTLGGSVNPIAKTKKQHKAEGKRLAKLKRRFWSWGLYPLLILFDTSILFGRYILGSFGNHNYHLSPLRIRSLPVTNSL